MDTHRAVKNYVYFYKSHIILLLINLNKNIMLPLIALLFLCGRVSTQCENSKAVKLTEMLQDVLDLNVTVQALVEIVDVIKKQV